MSTHQPDRREELVRAMTPDAKAALVDVMRRRRDQVTAEIARLQEERQHLTEWLAEHDPDATDQQEGSDSRG